MKKIIYLHNRTKHLDKFFIALGILFLISAAGNLFGGDFGTMKILQILVLSLAGFYHMYYGSSIMKIPRVEVDESRIWLKNDTFSRPVEVPWDKIQEISFGSYLVEFHLTDGEKEFVRLGTQSPDTSIEIKQHIMDLASKMEIDVNPG